MTDYNVEDRLITKDDWEQCLNKKDQKKQAKKKENVTMMEISKGLEAVLEIELNDIEMYVMYNKYKQDEDDFVDIEKLNQEIFKDEKVKEEVESVKEEKKAEIEEEIPKENIEEKEDIKEDIDKNNE